MPRWLWTAAITVCLAGSIFAQDKPKVSPADATFNAALAALSERRFTDAEEAFRKVQTLDPTSTRGISGLVECLIAHKKNEEALAAASAELTKEPQRAELQLLYGNTA